MLTIQQLIPKKTAELMYSLVRTESSFVVIMTGSSQYNRETAALTLAKDVMCDGTRDEDCPCRSCRAAQENPDLLILKPSASGNLLTGATQSFVDFTVENPVVSSRKCALMFDVDRLTPAALGNLLKVLEEDLTLLSVIMTATSAISIPETLRSRSRVLHTGDNQRHSSFLRLMDAGASAKVSEELSRLSSFSKEDIVESKDIFVDIHKVVPTVLSNALTGHTLTATKKFLQFATSAKQQSIQIFVEQCIATIVDLQKTCFTATSHITQPSRLEWYLTMRDKIPSESILAYAYEAFRIALDSTPTQLRSRTVWALTGVSDMAKSLSSVEDK